MVGTANNFNLGVDGDDTEKLPDVAPKELTDEELLKPEQECTAEEEAWEKEGAGEEKETPRKITMKAFL